MPQETYNRARTRILNEMVSGGRTKHAEHPAGGWHVTIPFDGERQKNPTAWKVWNGKKVRVLFKPQSVFVNGKRTEIDPRDLPVEQFCRLALGPGQPDAGDYTFARIPAGAEREAAKANLAQRRSMEHTEAANERRKRDAARKRYARPKPREVETRYPPGGVKAWQEEQARLSREHGQTVLREQREQKAAELEARRRANFPGALPAPWVAPTGAEAQQRRQEAATVAAQANARNRRMRALQEKSWEARLLVAAESGHATAARIHAEIAAERNYSDRNFPVSSTRLPGLAPNQDDDGRTWGDE